MKDPLNPFFGFFVEFTHQISVHSISEMTKHIHSQSQPKGSVVMGIIDKYFEQAPGFQDVFDEETFYIFATVFTLATCLAAFVASRYITLKCNSSSKKCC